MDGEAYARYRRKGEFPAHLPDFVAHSVLDIDFDFLHSLGVEHVMMDLDQTLRRRHAKELEVEVVGHFHALELYIGFKSLNLVTNNRGNLEPFSEPLGANVFQPYKENGKWIQKPQGKFYQHVLDTLGTTGPKAVMIGDKITPDIKGANEAGIWTVLVKPRGKGYWSDRFRLVRLREWLLLKRSHRKMKLIERMNAQRNMPNEDTDHD